MSSERRWVGVGRWIIVLTVMVLVLPVVPAQSVQAVGGTYYVGSIDGATSVTTDCTSMTNTTCTLRGALAQNATDGGGGTVRFGSAFPAGSTITVNTGNTTRTETNVGVTLTSSVTLDGTGKRVTISGNNAVLVFNVRRGVTATFRALTITGGNANGATCYSGGSIFGNSVGGGMCNYGTTTVIGSTIAGNTAFAGGGISNLSTLVVVDSTVSGNSASTGGGIHNNAFFATATTTVTNSTVVGNSASANGGAGVRNEYGTTTVTNSIIAGNTGGGNCFDTITDGGHNLSYGMGAADTTCPVTFTRTQDLLLGVLANNGGDTDTALPASGSAAINAYAATGGNCGSYTPADGGTAVSITTDQRGVTRPQGSACDSGAVEVIPLVAPPPHATVPAVGQSAPQPLPAHPAAPPPSTPMPTPLPAPTRR